MRKYVISGSLDSASAVYFTRETSAVKSDPIMMPASTTLLGPRPRPEPVINVSPTAAAPNAIAVSCTPSIPIPRRMASAAPKLEPEATPSVSGVASGFENRL